MIRDDKFYKDKVDGLFTHLEVGGSDEKTAAYVIENIGKYIDKKAQTITNGICEGLDIRELIRLFEIAEKRLPQTPPIPQLKETKPNVKSRKSSR